MNAFLIFRIPNDRRLLVTASSLPNYFTIAMLVKLKPSKRFLSIVLMRSLSGGVKLGFSLVKSVSKLLTSFGDFYNAVISLLIWLERAFCSPDDSALRYSHG